MPVFQLDPGTALTPLTQADAVECHALLQANRTHLDRWLRWSAALQTPGDVAAFIAQFEEKLARGDGFHLGLRVEGRLAGGAVCWYIHRQNRNAEIGYWLGEDFAGRGLATRAAGAVVSQLFEQEGLHRIELQCAVENTASRAVAERLGARLEGIRRESHWITSRFLDHAVYGLLAGEWRGRG